MKNNFLLFLSVVFLGIGQIWGQTTEILNNNLRTQDNIDLWNPISVDFQSGGGGYARFTDLNSSLTTPEFNASAYNSIEVQMSVAKYGSGNDGPITVLYSLDGGVSWNVGGDSSTPSSSTYIGNTLAIDETSSAMVIRFTRTNSPSEKRFRDVIISGIGTGISCQDSNLVFPTATETADLVDGTFTQTATSLNATTAITYESSDEAVATVNPSTGEVSLLGLGTTTITANQEAGTHNATDYCAGTATYELTVISTEPVLIVSSNSLSFTAFAGGASATEDITINGANLTGDIALSLTGDTNFSIDPNTLSASGGTITVTYTPSASPATHSATLTVSNGALSEVIALSGTTNEVPAIGCFEENFDDITAGNSTDSNGSNLAWEGNDNFPTVSTAFQAGGAVRLGTSNNMGSITSVPLTDYVGQNVTVSFSSKAWGTASTSILVSFGTQSKVVNLPAASAWTNGLSDYEITFENIDTDAALKFESNSTSERRFFIDNISVCIDGPSIPTPTLTTSVSELTDFVYGLGNGPSTSQSFALSGTNLDGSEDITILAGDGFEISLDDVDYFEEETLSAYDGTATDIYVRLKAGLTVGHYSDIILIDGYETDATVNISGEVTAPVSSLFRSKANGYWTSTATWESSANGTEWWAASTYPDESATDVEIQENHKVILNSADIKIANTEVSGKLEIRDLDFQLMGTGHALKIKNGAELILDGSGKPTNSSTGTALIETGGNFKVVSFSGSNNLVSNYLHVGSPSNKLKFEHYSIFEWANTNTLGSTGFDEIFDVVNPGDFVIFRMTQTFGSNYGGSTNNSFNAVLEIPEDKLLKLGGNGNKTFRGGIQGTGTLTVETTGSGKLIFGDTFGNPILGNTGSLTLNVPHNVLQLQNIEVPSSAQVKIESSGTDTPNTLSRIGGNLDISGELDITDMRIVNTEYGGITVKDGGTLRTRYTGGLFGSGSAIVDATKFTMETGSTIDYYATENQAISTGKEYYHLILSGGGIKTPQSLINFYTIDSIQYGSITITENPIVDFSGNNLGPTALNHVNFNMDGGRLILGTGGTQPNMRGTYNLSGGVIEFANSSASGQTIRSTNAYSYQNIEVTGNSVGTSGGNLVLNENGTFVVKPNGIFTINTNSIVGSEGNQTIEIEGNGTFRTGNSDGFSGGDGTSNPGQTTSIRNNIENIILHPNSIVEYSRSGDQTITNGIVTTPSDAHYQNLRISGSGVKTTALGNLVVNNITYVDAATLRVAETNDDVAPNVLTARKGIQVVSGATALFENNANLMQDDGAVNIGDITVERFVQDMNNVLPDHMDYVYWSSPVTGQGIHDGTNSIFSPGTPKNRNYQYHEPTDYFVPTPDQTFTPGKGYAIRAETGPNPDNNNENFENGYDKTYTFTGIANNGLVSIPIQKSPDNPEGVEHGYNLVGNPYPSNIDADVLFDLNETQIEPVIYLWTNNITQPYQPGSSYTGESYATYNRVGGVSAGENADPAGSGWSMNEEPNGIIKVGQGFIIKAKEGANSLQFQNMAGTTPLRITDQGFFFQRNLSQKDRFWLEQKSPLGMINSTLVGYVLGATNEFEKDYDAPMLTETSDAIYTVMDSIKLSIQGRSFPLELTDVVPLGLNHFEAGVYTIGIRKVDGIFNQQSIYLRDKQKEIVHNLSLDGEYVYETNAGELTDRFEIIFQEDEVMSTSDLLDNSIKIYHTDQNIVIESEKEKILSVEVYDLNGRKVHSKDRINSNLYQIRKTSLATQVFVVKVLTDGGKVETRKIINQ